MRTALDHFEQNLARARNLAGLSTSLAGMTTPAVDTTDLLRAALVLSVSALDHFVHEFTRMGMLDIHAQKRPVTPAFLEFRVSMSAVREAESGDGSDEWLDLEIRKRHGWISFQFPDSIADAIRLVSPVRLWEAVAMRRNEDPRTTKAQLRAIVERRNKIAHEADLDPTNPGERWPIDRPLVEGAMDFMESVVRAIYGIAGPGTITTGSEPIDPGRGSAEESRSAPSRSDG